MKKIVLCFAILLVAGTAYGQRGLNSNAVFRGKVVPTQRMVTTEVRGGSMATYKLDYYKGVNFQVDTATVTKVAAIVASDSEGAVSCETERVGELLTYALIHLKPSGKLNRYLCYQARSTGYTWVVTLLYLEGVATLEDLHTMFEKQETKAK